MQILWPGLHSFVETSIRLVEVRIVWHQISVMRRRPPVRNFPFPGLQDPATLWEPLAMRCHRIAAPEVVRSARTSAFLVWTTVTEAIPEVSAAPVPLDLLGVRMPVATLPHPAENGLLVAEIDDFVAVVVVILHDSTATSGLQDWLLRDCLDS